MLNHAVKKGANNGLSLNPKTGQAGPNNQTKRSAMSEKREDRFKKGEINKWERKSR